MIDVKEFLRTHSIEELNRSAEQYFSKIGDWKYELSKPFAEPEESAKLLAEFWAALKGLDVAAGMEVLDFGPGGCWTSHILTQLGCKVFACDISPTALEIGKQRYRDHPAFGEQPSPEFLVYDGLRFPLPDRSVDRILCLHALHHVPNVSHVLSEMSRVLRDDGRASFAEPGPIHSTDPISQRELENGVLENDIVIEDIWSWALDAGFSRIELTPFPVRRVSLTLSEYNAFIHGDEEATRKVLEPIREHAAFTRTFCLHKEKSPILSSARKEGLSAIIEGSIGSATIRSTDTIVAAIRITNTGQAVWLQHQYRSSSVNLGAHLRNLETRDYQHDYARLHLRESGGAVRPGEILTLPFPIPTPPPGTYELTFDLVSEYVSWFGDLGTTTPLVFRLEVLP